MPKSVAPPKITADRNAARFVCPLASISDATVNPSGSLCKKIAMKIKLPSHAETSKPRSNSHAVKKSMDHEPHQRRIARMRMRDLLVMRLLAKMKMRRNRMLEEVNQKIPGKNKEENRVGIVDQTPQPKKAPPAASATQESFPAAPSPA